MKGCVSDMISPKKLCHFQEQLAQLRRWQEHPRRLIVRPRPCTGIDLAYQNGRAGEIYNLGGRNERNNNYIAATICSLLDEIKPKLEGSYKDQITYVEDRAGHDRRYAIDATKLENELSWKADENFETGIRKTIEWYVGVYEVVERE